MVRLLPGPIPEPDDLIGREAALQECEQILTSSNLLLLAPRRFGKSGIMRYFLRKSTALTPLWLHLEDVNSGPQFAQRLIRALRTEPMLLKKLRTTGGRARKFLGRVEEINLGGVFQTKLGSNPGNDWEEVAGAIIETLEEMDRPTLFLWDELPSMLRNMADREGLEATRTFLAWFRALRLDGDDRLRRNRFIVAGSTGLNYLLDRRLADPDLINDFRRYNVEPLAPPAAAELCRQLAACTGFTIEADAIGHLLARIGQAVPYFIQLFFAQAEQTRTHIGRTLTMAAIDTVFANQIVGVPCKAYFDQYRRRLKRYAPPVEAAVIAILAAIARSAQPLSLDDLYALYAGRVGAAANDTDFAELLADLECDWYLTCDPQTGRYAFYMAVMRDWWARWYGPAVRGPQGK
jgi:hypothetical protein